MSLRTDGVADARSGDAGALAHVKGAEADWQILPSHMFSRLLYPNPVCVLTTWDDEDSTSAAGAECSTSYIAPSSEGGMLSNVQSPLHAPVFNGAGAQASGCVTPPQRPVNAMVISWLTCIDNNGLFLMSVNQSRHTTANLMRCPRFTLSVAVEGMEPLLLRIAEKREGGGILHKHLTSGIGGGTAIVRTADHESQPRNIGKCAERGIPMVPTAWQHEHLIWPHAVSASPTHIACQVVQLLAPAAMPVSSRTGKGSTLGHNIFLCRIQHACIAPLYWDAKTYALPKGSAAWPRILTFLGSGRFGAIDSAHCGPASHLLDSTPCSSLPVGSLSADDAGVHTLPARSNLQEYLSSVSAVEAVVVENGCRPPS